MSAVHARGSDLLEGHAHARMHLRVVLGDWLDVVVPALLFACKAPQAQLLKPVLLGLKGTHR